MTDSDCQIRAFPAFHLMRAAMACWKFHAQMPAIGLATTTVEQEGEIYGNPEAQVRRPITLQGIGDMPYDLLQVVRGFRPRPAKREARTSGTTHYPNECHSCATSSGDFYLFNEPDGPFLPTAPESAACVEIFDLPMLGTLEMEADFRAGGSDSIFARHSK